MDIDDDKYLSPGPATPSQLHMTRLTPPSSSIYLGEGLDTIKEEACENMAIDPNAMSGVMLHPGHMHGMRGEKEKGTFWPEKPKIEHPAGCGGVKASTVLTNLQRGNIPTIMQTVVEPVFVAGPHQRAGQGELRPDDLVENDVNERDSHGRTPLMWSASYGQSPTLSLLVRHGADVRARAHEGETALHYAASSGHHDAIRILINQGAEIDALDENDCTPLMFAAMQNNPHCVNELLSHGSDFTKSDFNGETALSLAVNNGSKAAQRVLESHVLSVLKGMVSGKDNGSVVMGT